MFKTLPDTAARARQELTLHLSLGASLIPAKGYSAAEVDQAYTRAQELCLQVGEPLQTAQVLWGRLAYNAVRGNLKAALALGEQFLIVAHRRQDTILSLVVHAALGSTLLWRGEFTRAQAHLDQAGAFYDPEHHRDLIYHIGQEPGLTAQVVAAETLWFRGYPDQALDLVRYSLSVAHALSHPLSLAMALVHIASVHLFRREGKDAHTQVEMLLTLAHEYGFAQWFGWGTSLRGWALVESAVQSGAENQREAGLVQLREGLTALRATGAELWVPLFLGVLAQGYGHDGQVEEGLQVIAEALAMAEKNEERWNEAELYRIKGELALQSRAQGPELRAQEAEACFHNGLAVARQQEAKSLELRVATSLARLWQQQGKTTEARDLLAPIYEWFTEGFETKDLKEAKALLVALA